MKMNGYSIVVSKIVEGVESNEYIPMFIDNKDIEKQIEENKIIKFGIRHLEKKLNK